MRGRLLALALALTAASQVGCVYYNTLYNARERFEAGERARLAGDPVAARAAYDEAVEKAARGFRSDPGGRWADDALYLMGRAWFRTGELARAIRALEEVRARTDDPRILRGSTLYLGAALTRLGEGTEALTLLNEAMRGLSEGALAAEGHFWRGVLHLDLGRRDQGLWDLERSAEADPTYRVPSYLQRAAYGVAVGDTTLVRSAVARLAATPAGAARVDSVGVLVGHLVATRGAGAAAAALLPVRQAVWPPGPRDALILRRIHWLADADHMDEAATEARWLAEGAGPRSAEARLALARWRLEEVQEVMELGEVRDLLLPAAGEPEVVRLAEAIRMVELLDGWGGEREGVAWFAAGEVARDALDAPRLARAFFLRYVAEHPGAPWAGKAILAAVATTPDTRGDPALQRGLEARTSDPYVAQARTGSVGAERMERLEARLAERLDVLLARARFEARRRDLFLRGADTLGISPGSESHPPPDTPTAIP